MHHIDFKQFKAVYTLPDGRWNVGLQDFPRPAPFLALTWQTETRGQREHWSYTSLFTATITQHNKTSTGYSFYRFTFQIEHSKTAYYAQHNYHYSLHCIVWLSKHLVQVNSLASWTTNTQGIILTLIETVPVDGIQVSVIFLWLTLTTLLWSELP